ncbi:MAG: hypothetical protein JWN33_66 [Candidatus Saccharibacteria bacterium]|nr:hypothetical protein [Candidatus Saccharibacteria bacterium]
MSKYSDADLNTRIDSFLEEKYDKYPDLRERRVKRLWRKHGLSMKFPQILLRDGLPKGI